MFLPDIDLSLNFELANRYKSETQRVRVVSEAWAERNVFCCSCGGSLTRGRTNAAVLDLACAKCRNEFELNSTRGSFGTRVPDGAFASMMSRIKDATSSPDFFFLTYDVKLLSVTNFFAVPSYFLDATVIEKRKPLSPNARRAGWVGCNIILSRVPEAGKVFYVKDSKIVTRSTVIETWRRTYFLRRERNFEARGWALEILRNIQSLSSREFTLQDMYKFESHLKHRFPRNSFIREKIRQQLQVLRDAGLIVFKGRGLYEVNFGRTFETTDSERYR
jgi:type II restriction enzyme